MPGKTLGHHSPRMIWFAPAAIMPPHSAVGGRMPAPRNVRPAVKRIAQPIVTEAWISAGVMEFGSTCRNATASSVLPIARAASTWRRVDCETTSTQTRRR